MVGMRSARASAGAPAKAVHVMDAEVTIDNDDEDTGDRTVGARCAALRRPVRGLRLRHRTAAGMAGRGDRPDDRCPERSSDGM